MNPAYNETNLILNADGSVYHLKLLPEELADIVITVGDPERVEKVSKYFDKIEVKKASREFHTHTGYAGRKRITVISTGIGTDNIDIVLNELDALANINLRKREPNASLKQLNIIRIGTSGALQEDTPVDSLLASSVAIGLDGLMQYYVQDIDEAAKEMLADFKNQHAAPFALNPYITQANDGLLSLLAANVSQGITVTATGFYSPQGRSLRAPVTFPDFLSRLASIKLGERKIANLEMETAGIYGLASCLGHKAISFNVILANRHTSHFSKNPEKAVDHHIKMILEKIADKL